MLQGIEVGLAWFPKGEYELAIELWPSIREDWAEISHPAYCRSFEGKLVELRDAGTGVRWVAPITINEYVKWCEQQELDPEASASRAQYAAEVVTTAAARAGPPGRNDPCWCGSMTKYQRCCGGCSGSLLAENAPARRDRASLQALQARRHSGAGEGQ